MSDVVERVARAIYGEAFDDCHDSVKARMIEKAVKVIASVHEPNCDTQKTR